MAMQASCGCARFAAASPCTTTFVAGRASPPQETAPVESDPFSPFRLEEPWWSEILCEGTELQRFKLDIKSELETMDTKALPVLPAAVPAADAPSAAHASPDARSQRRAAAQQKQLHKTAAPAAAKPRKHGAAQAASGTKQRPSAVKRLVGAGHVGRPPKGQGFPWEHPAVQKRLRELKAVYIEGKITQSDAAATLRMEFNNKHASHATVSRRFKDLP
ncbi:Lysophosphatidylcholine acyltransferase [Chlorella sorokiniana]|uniref:Lysophosphatidylcholine acyltransferase n=1 Tax=Chlorella sorokiniana TaxID=3076 RepID=A0A2P6TJK6_CHLSO|nr:Lysophosphatidylcholine acyltransferase [Chlorella sorokiniana]|eukprot:PRW44249.1 Lysophosphatidylcholine acyltransferase [Chlorella sorokiniana]